MATMRDFTSQMMATDHDSMDRGFAEFGHPWADYLPPSASKLKGKHLASEKHVPTAIGTILIIGFIAAGYVLLKMNDEHTDGNYRRLLLTRPVDYRLQDITSHKYRSLHTSEEILMSATAKPLCATPDCKDEVSFNPELTSLVNANLIPSVLDSFRPTVSLEVVYNGVVVTNGVEMTWKELTPFLTGSSPTIKIGGSFTELFTMFMVDPDAPSPDDPTAGQFCHWLWVNVPGGSIWGSGDMPAAGNELLKYIPPNPPIGLHRYVIVVYQQPRMVEAEALESRTNFDVKQTAASFGFGQAAAAVYFLAQRDPDISDTIVNRS